MARGNNVDCYRLFMSAGSLPQEMDNRILLALWNVRLGCSYLRDMVHLWAASTSFAHRYSIRRFSPVYRVNPLDSNIF
jgi:hypothetical protein